MRCSGFHKNLVVLSSAAVSAASMSWAPSALASDPLQTIYSAEHALYGAGYDIGRADGWIDDTLRSAIREYQSNTGELKISGSLDAPTLKALGVNTHWKAEISGNPVSTRDQALAALKLTQPEPSPAQPAPKPVVAVKPQPVTPAKPEPRLEQTSAPVDEPDVVESETVDKGRSVAIQPVTKYISKPVEVRKQPEKSEESRTKVVVTTTSKVIANAPVAAPDAADLSEPTSSDEGTTEETELVALVTTTAPSEPAEPGPGQAEAEAPPPRSDPSGGLFNSLFDFLFGWLV